MIKQRNLDPSLVQWIMTTTGLGPGIGEFHWAAPAASATSQFRTQLQRWGVEQNYKIHTTIASAENEAVANRNDVILAMPGNYIESARLAWDKDHTHLLGLGGRNNRGGDYGVYVLTTDTGVIEVIDITAKRCQFHGVAVGNFGNAAACKAAVTLDGPGNYFNGVHFAGNLYDAQAQNATCCSLRIHTDGDNALFEDCIVGTNVNAIRTQAASGQLLFTATPASGPVNGKFKGCTFLSYAQTAAVPMVALTGQVSIDRLWQFEDSMFHNFWVNWGGTCERVFYAPINQQTSCISLKNCMASGYDEWQDSDQNILFQSDMPTPGVAGGLAVEPTTT